MAGVRQIRTYRSKFEPKFQADGSTPVSDSEEIEAGVVSETNEANPAVAAGDCSLLHNPKPHLDGGVEKKIARSNGLFLTQITRMFVCERAIAMRNKRYISGDRSDLAIALAELRGKNMAFIRRFKLTGVSLS